MFGLDLSPTPRRASRPVVRAPSLPLSSGATDASREADGGMGPERFERVIVSDDPPGPAETHAHGCLCGTCFRRCLDADPPWWAPYRLEAFHAYRLAELGRWETNEAKYEAERMRKHELLVARGMWLARTQQPIADPPTLTDALDEYLDRLANRMEVID